MTREERKKAIKVLDDMKVKIDVPKAAKMQNDKNWALDMAIKTLEQEPVTTSMEQALLLEVIDKFLPTECEDAISREAVLKVIDGWYEQNRETENIEDLIILITYMSSVTPSRRNDESEFLEFLYNHINPNDMEHYRQMFEMKDAVAVCGAEMESGS